MDSPNAKDIQNCLSILKDKGSCFYPVEAPNGKGISTGELEQNLLHQGVSKDKIYLFSSISNSLENALKHHQLILVCGTFFIMGEAKKALQIIEPFDNLDLK